MQHAPPSVRQGFAATLAFFALAGCATREPFVEPDIVVAADGSGHFTSVHQAVQAIPRENRERRIVLVRNGLYRERVRIDAPYVTLRGESRAGTRIEFAHPASAPIDANGRAVLDIGPSAHDLVVENLTIENTHGVIGLHAFAVLGYADRTIIQDSDVLSQGNDTLSLWRGTPSDAEAQLSTMPGATPLMANGGRYYHARLNIRGSVDFVAPRGWCYMRDSTITQLNPKAEAALWHDGRGNPEKKFVLRNIRVEGPPGFPLARRHHDGQFFFVGCRFSGNLRDKPPYRVIYPLQGGTPTEADVANNRRLDLTNSFGDRNYFHDCHREGGDYDWHRDNLSAAPGSPAPEQVTAKWTYGGTWDPERIDSPTITSVSVRGGTIEAKFSELVTVKGVPRLLLADGEYAEYRSGSGSNTLIFSLPSSRNVRPVRLSVRGGAIIATEAASTLRIADLRLPSS